MRIHEASTHFNKTTFGNIRSKNRRLLKCINGIKRILIRVDSSWLSILEKKLLDDYEDILHQEEIMLFQKSRDDWIKAGDKNTKYFHTQTLIKRQHNRISGLNINDQWVTDHKLLQDHATENFHLRLSAQPGPPLSSGIPPSSTSNSPLARSGQTSGHGVG